MTRAPPRLPAAPAVLAAAILLLCALAADAAAAAQSQEARTGSPSLVASLFARLLPAVDGGAGPAASPYGAAAANGAFDDLAPLLAWHTPRGLRRPQRPQAPARRMLLPDGPAKGPADPAAQAQPQQQQQQQQQQAPQPHQSQPLALPQALTQPMSPPDKPGGGFQLPPHVYLISFLLLIGIMVVLLSAHCWRLCRMARRMQQLPPGTQGAGPLSANCKRGTPDDVIGALPIRRYASFLHGSCAPNPSGAACSGDGSCGCATAAAHASLAGAEQRPQPEPQQQQQQQQQQQHQEQQQQQEQPQQSPLSPAACPAGALYAAEEPCAVCFEDFGDDDLVKLLPCGHIFHPDCVDAWLRIDRVCPVCRRCVFAGPQAGSDDATGADAPGGAAGAAGQPHHQHRRLREAAARRPMPAIVLELALASAGVDGALRSRLAARAARASSASAPQGPWRARRARPQPAAAREAGAGAGPAAGGAPSEVHAATAPAEEPAVAAAAQPGVAEAVAAR